MTGNSGESRYRRGVLTKEIGLAHRNSTSNDADARARVPRHLDMAAAQADALAQVARLKERDGWARVASLIRQGALTDAAEDLDALDYEIAAWMLSRIWRCQCGAAYDTVEYLDEHIDISGRFYSGSAPRIHAAERDHNEATP